MSLTSAGPTGHGAASVDGGEVIYLHEYARLRSRDVDQTATMIDAERNVHAKYARLAIRICSRVPCASE